MTGRNTHILQLLLVVSVTLTAGVYRNGFPAIFPFLRAEFAVSRAVLGLYVSFLYLVSAGLAVFAGWLADRTGAKRALFWGLGSLGVLVVVHALAPTYIIILLLGILCGIGFSIISPGTSKAVADRFPADRRGTPMGLVFVGWSAGGLLGAAAIPALSEIYGWRWTTAVMGAAMLLVVATFYLFYRETAKDEAPPEPGTETGRRQTNDASFRTGFTALISNRPILLLCLMGLMLGSMSGILATHYTLFVHLDYGYREAVAGAGFAVLHIGSMVGRPAWGQINDRLLAGREQLGLLILSAMSALVLLAFFLLSRLFAVPPVALLLPLTFFAGFSGRGWPGVLFTAISRRADEDRAGMALGFGLIFVRLGITVAPPIFGYVADLTGTYELSWLLTAVLGLAGGLAFFLVGGFGRSGQ